MPKRDLESDAAIGERIIRYRKERQMKQAELARRLGHKGPTSVYKYEQGKTSIDIPTAIKIAKQLDVSLDALLLGKETANLDATLTDAERDHLFDQYNATDAERTAFIDHLRTSPNRVNSSYVVGWLLGLRGRGSPQQAADVAINTQARDAHVAETRGGKAAPPNALRRRKPPE